LDFEGDLLEAGHHLSGIDLFMSDGIARAKPTMKEKALWTAGKAAGGGPGRGIYFGGHFRTLTFLARGRDWQEITSVIHLKEYGSYQKIDSFSYPFDGRGSRENKIADDSRTWESRNFFANFGRGRGLLRDVL
jgi:hypothetical protein